MMTKGKNHGEKKFSNNDTYLQYLFHQKGKGSRR